MSKTMVVGLTPEYIPHKSKNVGQHNERLHSTNHGAAFITRSIMKIFNGDFIDINENHDFNQLRNKYSKCVIATASQLGPERDLSKLLNFIENLDIKTFFLSGGVDAGGKYCVSYKLHPSIVRLLEICSADNSWIGVRGDLSAYYLHRHGFKTSVPIGCPTIFSNGMLDYDYQYNEKEKVTAVPFHWVIAAALIGKPEKYDYIGQDTFDEELFNGNISGAVISRISKVFKKPEKEVFDGLKRSIGPNSIFPKSYSDWYDLIGRQTRILSGRLHANICGLIQGVPSVLVPWDMRTFELVDYLSLPNVSWEALQKNNPNEVFKTADFSAFRSRIRDCYANWLSFNESNGLEVFTGKDMKAGDLALGKEWQQSARLLASITQYVSDDRYNKFKTVDGWALKEWIIDKIKDRQRL